MAAKVDWLRAFRVETDVADIISRQEKRGVWFDTQRAKWYVHLLTERILKIDLIAVPQMPKMIKPNVNMTKPFKKSGQPCVKLEKWLEENPCVSVGGPFTGVEYLPFDMGKVGLFKDWLLQQGWIPDQWNLKDVSSMPKEQQEAFIKAYIADLRVSPSGDLRMGMLKIKRGVDTIAQVKEKLRKARKLPTTPKITEESLATVETQLGQMLMQRMVWSHRRSLLEGLIAQVRPGSRLGAAANPCATPTMRMRHSVVVNIPAARSPFGKELRGLFMGTPQDGLPLFRYTFNKKQKILRGRYPICAYDGAGLELRMFAHYLNNPEYTFEVTDGDVHTANQIAAGLPTRDAAKTFLYGWLYGAGDSKIGSIVGGTSKDGARLKDAFLSKTPGLSSLIDSVKRDAERGYLVGLDGRLLHMRRNERGEVMAHKALNTLLQGAGAVVMKYAMVWLEGQIKGFGLRAWKLLDQHDEAEYECHPEDVPKLLELMNDCVKVAGEQLKLNCPLKSDAIVGKSWYEVH